MHITSWLENTSFQSGKEQLIRVGVGFHEDFFGFQFLKFKKLAHTLNLKITIVKDVGMVFSDMELEFTGTNDSLETMKKYIHDLKDPRSLPWFNL